MILLELGDGNPRVLCVWWAKKYIGSGRGFRKWFPIHYYYRRVFQHHRLSIWRLVIDWRFKMLPSNFDVLKEIQND